MRSSDDPLPPRRRRARLLASLGAACAALFGTLVLGSIAILLSWIPPKGKVMLWLSRRWARLLLFCSGVAVQADYEGDLDPGRSYVFLVNHQSYFDIPALLPTIPVEIRFAAKRSLFRIPVFGWSLSAGGFIPIDRDDRSRAREAFAAAAERLRGGVSVLFFPEGSRSWDGRLGTFERGGFLLALRLRLPIVPVGISGARQVQPRGRLAVDPGTIRVRYGTPIDPAAYGLKRKRELIADVRRRVAELAGVELEEDEPGAAPESAQGTPGRQ